MFSNKVHFVITLALLTFYSYCSAQFWDITSVDSDTAGAYCSMTTINDLPAIAYRHDGELNSLKYAKFDGSKWQITTIEVSPQPYNQFVEYISLARMPNDQPAIALFDSINNDLRFIHFDGSIWQSTTIDSSGTTGRGCCLNTIAGQPAISYLGMNNELKYARFDGTNWQIETIDTSAKYASDMRTSLKAQPNGQPAIAYYAHSLKYASYDGTSWNITTVDNSTLTGRCAELEFSPSGNPAISYYYLNNHKLMYASFDGTNWNTDIVYSCGVNQTLGTFNSMAFLPDGTPVIGWYLKYTSSAYGKLNFTWLKDDGQWQTSTIDGKYYQDNLGLYCSLDILDNYSVAVAYYDIRNYKLKYAQSAMPLLAADPAITPSTTAWIQRTDSTETGDDYAYSSDYFCTEAGYVNAEAFLDEDLPGIISGGISLSGQYCDESECLEWDPETGDCLLLGRCLEWDPETGDCINWEEGSFIEMPGDSSGEIQLQYQINPTPAMPLETEVCVHLSLISYIEDPGLSEIRSCRVYINDIEIEELSGDGDLFINASVGDNISVEMNYYIEGDDYYQCESVFNLNIYNEACIEPMYPDICGSQSAGPDGIVNIYDFNCLAIEWLNTTCTADSWCNNADFNQDGSVDLSDLNLLADKWLNEIIIQ